MSYWTNKKVLVTGGSSFLGSFVVEKLRERGCKEIFVPRSKDYDLVESEACKRLYKDAKPGIVIHLAAKVGGISANRSTPGKFFYDNLMKFCFWMYNFPVCALRADRWHSSDSFGFRALNEKYLF